MMGLGPHGHARQLGGVGGHTLRTGGWTFSFLNEYRAQPSKHTFNTKLQRLLKLLCGPQHLLRGQFTVSDASHDDAGRTGSQRLTNRAWEPLAPGVLVESDTVWQGVGVDKHSCV